MTNAEKFKEIFGLYATELWSKSEKNFLNWLNAEVLEQEPCSDAISRQAAMDAIGFPSLNALLADLPSVHAEPRTGHWIETAEDYYKAINEYGGGVNEDTPYFTDDCACSVCLAKFSVIDNETERFDYCPSCGAKMEADHA